MKSSIDVYTERHADAVCVSTDLALGLPRRHGDEGADSAI